MPKTKKVSPIKNKVKPITDIASGRLDVSYEFPKSEEIVIHKSDLQIQLERFKKRILATFSVFDLVAIMSLWAPVFSSDFKAILGIESQEIQVGYAVFAILITIFILWSRVKYFVVNLFGKTKTSSDSEKMAENILIQCNSKTKK